MISFISQRRKRRKKEALTDVWKDRQLSFQTDHSRL